MKGTCTGGTQPTADPKAAYTLCGMQCAADFTQEPHDYSSTAKAKHGCGLPTLLTGKRQMMQEQARAK